MISFSILKKLYHFLCKSVLQVYRFHDPIFLLDYHIYMELAPCNYHTNKENLSAFSQFLQYRHNIRLCWRELYATFQHIPDFSRFLLNLSGSVLTCQYQMISGDRVFSLYVFFRYREHILYQKCALPTVIQFNDVENIARFPGFFFFLHNSSVSANTTGQWYHPVILVFVSSKQY